MKPCIKCGTERDESAFPKLCVHEVIKNEPHRVVLTPPYRRLWMCKECWHELVTESPT